MEEAALALNIRRIVTDSDLDGVVTGAILRRWWPEAEVVFGHPGNLRAGMMDHLIDRHTAICDYLDTKTVDSVSIIINPTSRMHQRIAKQ